MTSITVEQIYADYDVLSKADKAEMAKHVGLYRNLMSALKGGSQERRLAAQFLSKFLPNFPELADDVVNSLIDLLENDDILIRKQGVIELSACCKANHQLCAKVADVFAQLLVANDAGERTLVVNSLLGLFKLDSKGTLAGIFTQIFAGDEEVRHNTIKFVGQKLLTLPADTWQGDIEKLMIEYCNKAILGDCTLDEFIILVRILAGMPSLGTLQGRQQLIETIADVANFSQPFNAADRELVVRIMQCTRQALTLFSKNVPSNRFAVYVILNVLPNLAQVEPSDDATEFLKLAADLTSYLGPVAADQLTPLIDVAYNAVVAHMPMPSAAAAPVVVIAASDDEAAKPNGGEATNSAAAVQPETDEKLHFTNAECLLYLLHKLASRQSAYLTAERNAALKPRLQYFAQRNQLVMKQLKTALAGKKAIEIEADEALRVKQLALRTTTNVNALIIDLLHIPPSFKASVTLSWRQTASDNNDEKSHDGKHHQNNKHGASNGQENDAKRQKFNNNNNNQQQRQGSGGHQQQQQRSGGQGGGGGGGGRGGQPWRGGRGGGGRRF